MTFQPFATAAFAPSSIDERTALSRAFEDFYRALPREGLVPHRRAFRPEKAVRFLRHIVLCDVTLSTAPIIRMRLVGSALEENTQHDLTGQNYLHYLPERYHADAIETARQMIVRPCGLWQVTPLHYARGYGNNVEITAFPLAPDQDGVHVLVGLAQVLDGAIGGAEMGGRPLLADTASAFRYIDLGDGVPG